MLERYRTLGAMAALPEFTVEDLTRFSGVKPATVRTVLARESRRLERLDRTAGDGPGGRFYRYRLVDGEREAVLAELRDVEKTGQLAQLPADDGSNTASEDEIPAALLAGEHVLLYQLPAEENPERWAELFELAQVSISDGTDHGAMLAPGRLTPAAHVHARAAQLLLDLALLEQTAREDLVASPVIGGLYRELASVAAEAGEVGDHGLQQALQVRLRAKRVQQATPSETAEILIVVPDGIDAWTARDPVADMLRRIGVEYDSVRLADFVRLGPAQVRAARLRESIYLLAIPSAAATDEYRWRAPIQQFAQACGQGTAGLVVSAQFSPALNQEVHARGLRYVVTDGLDPSGLRGALLRGA
jgi:hypothetical protein